MIWDKQEEKTKLQRNGSWLMQLVKSYNCERICPGTHKNALNSKKWLKGTFGNF
jgi:hypothetical protein